MFQGGSAFPEAERVHGNERSNRRGRAGVPIAIIILEFERAAAISLIGRELNRACDDHCLVVPHGLVQQGRDVQLGEDQEQDLLLNSTGPQGTPANVLVGKIDHVLIREILDQLSLVQDNPTQLLLAPTPLLHPNLTLPTDPVPKHPHSPCHPGHPHIPPLLLGPAEILVEVHDQEHQLRGHDSLAVVGQEVGEVVLVGHEGLVFPSLREYRAEEHMRHHTQNLLSGEVYPIGTAGVGTQDLNVLRVREELFDLQCLGCHLR